MLYLNVNKTKPYICQYCGHGYTKESTLFTHVCEQKRRHLQKDDKAVRIGYDAFNRFFKMSQNSKGDKTYVEFAKSPYYNAFVKFGSYVSNVNPLYPDHYIDWVIRSGVKLDHWCRDALYEKYVLELIHTEPADVALERSIKHMVSWSKEQTTEISWSEYFSKVSSSRAMFDIKDGKISPWLLLNCKTGKELLSRFDDTQLNAIANVINPEVWIKKFKKNKEDMDMIKFVVKEMVT
jgi:hypothetical protein